MHALTAFDFFVLGVLVISLSIGVWRGVVGEILALAAWVVAFFVARQWGGRVGEATLAGQVDPAWVPLAGFLEVFVAVLLLVAFSRWLIAWLLKAAGLRPMDRFLGAAFGIARGVLVVWVAVLVAGFTALPQQRWWREAVLAPPFETAVIAVKPWLPPDLAKRIRYR